MTFLLIDIEVDCFQKSKKNRTAYANMAKLQQLGRLMGTLLNADLKKKNIDASNSDECHKKHCHLGSFIKFK